MKGKIFFAIFGMLVLLLGFPSSVVDFNAYAQKEKVSTEESEAYKKQQKNAEKREKAKESKEQLEKQEIEERKKLAKKKVEQQEKYKAKERKEQLKKQETEQRKKLAKKKVEQKEKYKATKKEVKSKYNEIRGDYKKKFDDLRDELKNKFRQLQTTQLTTQKTTALTSSEITEDNILEFEEKRMMLQKLKQKLREQILEIKTRAHMETEDLQNFLEEENERKIKVKAKLHVLKLKLKDRIKEHRISESSSLEDNGVVGNQKVVICHVPPGNPENEHSIRISYNAVHAHLAHGDRLGSCDEMPDPPPPDGKQITITVTESIGISDIEVDVQK